MNYHDKNNLNKPPLPDWAGTVQLQLPQHQANKLKMSQNPGDDDEDEDDDWDEGQYDDYEVALDTIMA